MIAPPFTTETALSKVQAAEDLWNSRDPERVALAYATDAEWRNRTEFLKGRERKTLWGFHGNRMAVGFECEWHNDFGQWFRSYGAELWEFDDDGLMRRRVASINDAPIAHAEQRICD